jgi:hypothetical protein
MHSQKEIIQWLVENYDKYLDYDEALEFAVRGQHSDIIQWMMDLGATDYGSALSEACENRDDKNFEWMVSLIEIYYTQEEKIQSYNDSLYYAAGSGDTNIVKKLIDLGANDYDDSCQVCGIPKEKIVKLILDKQRESHINFERS